MVRSTSQGLLPVRPNRMAGRSPLAISRRTTLTLTVSSPAT
jgi:hypothetical protein